MISAVIPFLNDGKSIDCLDFTTSISSSQYDRDSQPLWAQIQQPYITYYNEADGVVVGYICADTKYIDMIW